MLAIELSGIHVGSVVEFNYRFPSWSKTTPNTVRRVEIRQLEHKQNGRVHINKDDYAAREKFYVPFDSEVVLYGPKGS